MQTIEVDTADFAAAQSGYVLESSGIGSCIVVCLYDAGKKTGALCHIMLPSYPQGSELNPLRFADSALPLVFEQLERMGSQRTDLVAHVIGGANMFQNLGLFVHKIGEQNITAVTAILTREGIPVKSMDVGGTVGRSVSFALDSGVVNITSKA